jgi:amino acid permease
MISASLDQNNSVIITTLLCGLAFYVLFSLKIKLQSNVNTVLFALLIVLVFVILGKVFHFSDELSSQAYTSPDILRSLPIVFVSFGVQNVCPYVYKFLNKDVEKTKKSFLVGISIVAVVYISWIYVILCSIHSCEPAFYDQILEGKANSGDLINAICRISGSNMTHILLKAVSLLAIVTSALGIALGLGMSLHEIFRRNVMFLTVLIPMAITLIVPNAFMNILSFGGMIATIFVVFMPIYLHSLVHKEQKYNLLHILSVLYAVGVIIGEFIMRK